MLTLSGQAFDAHLAQVLEGLPDDPAVPAGVDPGGVAVALVDSGVNYLLESIATRLARDQQGRSLGRDFWDDDDRPFDANPVRSKLFPQRHGTRTAHIVLSEAPVAKLVPYRYPRPDMARMRALVEDAAGKRIRIMNLALGSNKREEWQAFEQTARAHPGMLFVISAGNNGRDIDQRPVFPAALDIDNAITVTSAEGDGRLAPGSNWGVRSVHLAIPAENMLTTGFDGHVRIVSGSSYAAARVSALAACLLAADVGQFVDSLKRQIIALATQPLGSGQAYTAHGFLADPDEHARGACAPAPRRLERLRAVPIGLSMLNSPYLLAPSFSMLVDAGWRVEDVRDVVQRAAEIVAQCGIALVTEDLAIVQGPEQFRYFHTRFSSQLVTDLALPKPAVVFLKDSLAPVAYGAESIGEANSAGRPRLRYTVWMTSHVPDPGISLAHELVHLLRNNGVHSTERDNLMREDTHPGHDQLTAAQCQAVRVEGLEQGLLVSTAGGG